MPSKPLKPCQYPSCRTLTGSQYCEDHKDKYMKSKRERNKQYDQYKRDKQSDAFYKSKEWDRARQQALIRDNGLCQHCLEGKRITLAEMVDHIIPVKIAWHLRVYLKNLQSLCDRCHKKKTADDKLKYGKSIGI